MKLAYSIPGKIWWIRNFLSYDMYKKIHNTVIKDRKHLNFETSKNVWPDNLNKNSGAPLIKKIDNDYKPFQQLLTLVKHNIYFPLDKFESFSVYIHYLKKNAGIDWHNDGNIKYGVTFYLNHRWNKKWGGELMFKDNNLHGWIPPMGNSLVIAEVPLDHKVNPVLTNQIPRISIQFFVK
jgi:hypothetical protein